MTIRWPSVLPVLLAVVVWIAQLYPLNAFGEGVEDYRLGPGDVVKLNVFEYPDLATETRITQGGGITFPLLGEVKIGGMTLGEAETVIANRLREGGFIRQPQVTVMVLQFQSQQIAVLGQVNKPGKYPIGEASTIMDLLALAGGVVTASASESATLLRENGEKVNIDLRALFDGDKSQDQPVKGGDTVYVPRAPQFYIYGEVQRPGTYRLERNMTVAQAISVGGGLTPRGTQWWPEVKRRNARGEEEEITVDESDLLQADDVLYVRESWF